MPLPISSPAQRETVQEGTQDIPETKRVTFEGDRDEPSTGDPLTRVLPVPRSQEFDARMQWVSGHVIQGFRMVLQRTNRVSQPPWQAGGSSGPQVK